MKVIRFSLVSGLLVAMLGFNSCSKKDKPVATVKFATADASYAEDIGTVNVSVSLSAVQSQDVTVNFTWTSPDTTAFLGANFTFVTASSVNIPAGQTSANIQIQAIDDTQIDGNNNITLTLTGTSTNAALNSLASSKVFDLTLTDNDVVPAGSLQMDLYWYTGSPTDDINGVNLDLTLQDSVKYTLTGTAPNQTLDIINPGETYTFSDNTTGFETTFLTPSDPDSVYFIEVFYDGGAGAANYLILLNGMGRSNDGLSGSFASSDAPLNCPGQNCQVSSQLWGPFRVVNGTFDFTSRTRSIPKMKGSKVLRFKPSGFHKK